jgi:hypothetical protein
MAMAAVGRFRKKRARVRIQCGFSPGGDKLNPLGGIEPIVGSLPNVQIVHCIWLEWSGRQDSNLRRPWSRTKNRCTKLLSRLGLFCVLYRLFVWYSGANGPKLDPNGGYRVDTRSDRVAYRIPCLKSGEGAPWPSGTLSEAGSSPCHRNRSI